MSFYMKVILITIFVCAIAVICADVAVAKSNITTILPQWMIRLPIPPLSCSTQKHKSECKLRCDCRWCFDDKSCVAFDSKHCHNKTSETHSCEKEDVIMKWSVYVVFGILGAICAIVILAILVVLICAVMIGGCGALFTIFTHIVSCCSYCCMYVNHEFQEFGDRWKRHNEGQKLIVATSCENACMDNMEPHDEHL